MSKCGHRHGRRFPGSQSRSEAVDLVLSDLLDDLGQRPRRSHRAHSEQVGLGVEREQTAETTSRSLARHNIVFTKFGPRSPYSQAARTTIEGG
jgi:hypothetical protein